MFTAALFMKNRDWHRLRSVVKTNCLVISIYQSHMQFISIPAFKSDISWLKMHWLAILSVEISLQHFLILPVTNQDYCKNDQNQCFCTKFSTIHNGLIVVVPEWKVLKGMCTVVLSTRNSICSHLYSKVTKDTKSVFLLIFQYHSTKKQLNIQPKTEMPSTYHIPLSPIFPYSYYVLHLPLWWPSINWSKVTYFND